MAKAPPSLPNELWSKILENLCDSQQRPDAWISYRNVSRTFKETIELIFREKHLPKTWIRFDKLGIHYNDEDEKVILNAECSFLRLSDDKTIATFKIEAGVEEYHDIICEHLTEELDKATFEKPCHFVQIRHDLNDTPIPGLSIDYEMFELHCDWRGLFTQFYGEEYLYNKRTQNWVKEKGSWVEDLKSQMQKGELNMMATLQKAMYAFADGSLESRKIARRVRIRRQYRENGDAWDFERNGDKDQERIIFKEMEEARKQAGFQEFSDDESGQEDDGEEDEDEDSSNEDDEWEDEDEDEDEIHTDDEEGVHD